jgi:hypothetical protein
MLPLYCNFNKSKVVFYGLNNINVELIFLLPKAKPEEIYQPGNTKS